MVILSVNDIIPNFSDAQILDIIKRHYGLVGTVKPLVSYEDQNALITTDDDKFVLKISNMKWPLTFIQTQIDVLKHLASAAPHLAFPSTVANSSASPTRQAVLSTSGYRQEYPRDAWFIHFDTACGIGSGPSSAPRTS